MAIYNTILDTVGNTPLVRLQRMPGDTGNVVLVKLEGNNPAGSVKDRLALAIILDAEKRGLLKPGDTIVEATSGNTGVALAAQRFYQDAKIPVMNNVATGSVITGDDPAVVDLPNVLVGSGRRHLASLHTVDPE